MHITSTTVSAPVGVLPLFSSKRASVFYRGRPFDNSLYGLPEPAIEILADAFSEVCGVKGSVFVPDVRKPLLPIAPHSMFVQTVAGSRVWNSARAEGVVIKKGQAALFSTRDCPTVVMTCPESRIAVAAHAGRFSLGVDFVRDGKRGIQHSVISAMLGCFLPSQRSTIEVAIVLSVSGMHFCHDVRHTEHGKTNREMIRFILRKFGKECFDDIDRGALSLPELIRRQCVMRGVKDSNIRHDGLDTYSTRLPSGEHAFYSNRRGDKSGGNLVLVSMG